MRDWQAYVRSHLALPAHSPDRHARSQITDWDRIARDVSRADRSHRQPRLERLANALDNAPGRHRGVQQMLSHLIRDVRFSIRQLLKTPGFSVVAILTLALGIGASSAIFSVVNGVLLRPLAYPNPEALVRVYEILQKFGRFSVAPATFLDWRQQNTVFDHISAFNATGAT